MRDTTDHIVDPTYDYTSKPWFEHGDERPCNWSSNPTFYDVCAARYSRRGVMAGGLATAVTGVFGASFSGVGQAKAADVADGLLGFEPVMISMEDVITVPPGYSSAVIARSGDPISGPMPAYSYDNSGEDQFHQVGQHHDGMHYFPEPGDPNGDGLLVMNHEYIEPRYLHGAYAGQALSSSDVVYHDGKRLDDEVLKEINAHGVSIMRITRNGDGVWEIVEDPRNRRITAGTPMEIAGPVRGSDHVKTLYSPDGTLARGTLNNCAHGVTPWGTYLTCEENWAGYFANPGEQPREHARYGVSTDPMGSRYGWHLAEGGADEFVRFNAASVADSPEGDYRNEPNTFGWVVEIDVQDPESTPIKRTHLGRFAHEGVVFGPVESGRPVVAYAGDDARFEYIYKFVSSANYEEGATDGSILDEGTLYVARFNDDGTGEWLALAPGENGLTPENGFADLADILVNTRLAADQAGATKMDRPEWGAVDPNSGEVYFTLTNNERRIQAQVDMANPVAGNQTGHIIRWREDGDDHTATTFAWELFVIAGEEHRSADLQGNPLDETNIFACPDGLWFDADSRLWIQTDIGESAQVGALAHFGNNCMLAANPETGEIRRFLTGPIGQEITGVITTPDQKTMFINVQHPGATTTAEDYAAGNHGSNWPDGGDAWPRSATVIITKDDGEIVGT